MTALKIAVDFIANEEGFRSEVYLDVAGVPTIGFGETDAKLLKKYKDGITEEEAYSLLAVRVDQFMQGVRDLLARTPTDKQLAALTSLAYNIGLGEDGFAGSTTLRRFNDGDIPGAAVAIKWWNKAMVDGSLVVVEGLINRRDREYDLFMAPDVVPDATPSPPDVSNQQAVLLISANSALALDVENGSLEAGAKIMQFPVHSGLNQQWVITPVPKPLETGLVAIVAVHSQMVLDVGSFSLENGAEIIQHPFNGGGNQQWRMRQEGPNMFRFQNYHSGKWLDIREGSVDAGARLIQWDYSQLAVNQIFCRARVLGNNPVVVVVTPPEPTPEQPLPPAPEPPTNFDVGAALRSIGFPVGDEEDIYGFQCGFAFFHLEVDGIAGPSTIQAIQYSIDRGGRCGAYFTFAEFGCKHCGRPRIWREQVWALDRYREAVGPVTIISGTRCEDHNRNVGGASNSQHRPYPNNRGTSTASDIPGAVTVDWLRNQGWFSGIGYVPSEGKVVVHVDSRGDGPNNTTGGSRDNPTEWQYR